MDISRDAKQALVIRAAQLMIVAVENRSKEKWRAAQELLDFAGAKEMSDAMSLSMERELGLRSESEMDRVVKA